ncbi:hypothetical protein J1TS3_05090 [Siminovitchia fordii]|uniref:Uncharacterized protein n=1 Tax=Siminovitchia fordii TaxID=254759 RepID=A0ABQ4K0T3_9BACI|nr:hypothetical protein J1TS3_05090 [Siminovitchia fordii]
MAVLPIDPKFKQSRFYKNHENPRDVSRVFTFLGKVKGLFWFGNTDMNETVNRFLGF